MSNAEALGRRRSGVAKDVDVTVTAVALVAIAVLFAATGAAVDLRQAALALVGAALGFVLYHASFGITGSWRAFIVDRKSARLRAQAIMLAIATVLMLPFIAQGEFFGTPVTGALGPVGTSLVVGALMFGFGMQLGGGCGSGTLFAVGGGNMRMLVTLIFFIVGAVLGAAHLPWWSALPDVGVIRLVDLVGLPLAVALTLAALAFVWLAAALAERVRHAEIEKLADPLRAISASRLLKGPWPLLWGAVALPGLNLVTLAVAGHPRSITFAFNLWGAKALAAFGVDVAAWEYWTWPMPAQALASPVLAESTSVMDFGLVLGALLATGLAGKFAPDAHVPLRPLPPPSSGDCCWARRAPVLWMQHRGAFRRHRLRQPAWLGVVRAAFAGSALGVRSRPLFGLANR